MNSDFQDALILGTVTFLIGSALMVIPFKGIWWAYTGTFLVGFLGFYSFGIISNYNMYQPR